jgi:flagellar hook-associated protein 3 FlgL
MRISTSWAQQLGLNSMLGQQVKLSKTQMQLATGKKILAPSDDPSAAARIVDLNQSIKQAEQYQSNINTARQRLSLEGGLLQNAVDILQRINELGIRGLNDTNSQSDREAIAAEMEELKDQLLDLSNTRNANGEYLFAGYKTDTEPFSKDPDPLHVGAYIYAGDANQRSIQIGTDRSITDGDPGTNVFGVPTGVLPAIVPAPGSITNVFEAIDKFITDLKNNTPQTGSLADVASSLNKITTIESSIGVRLNALDSQEGINTDFILNMKTVLSGIEDLDYASAISNYNLQTVALQAAQQAFAKVQDLSLFKFL